MISLQFVPKSVINHITFVHIMAWRRPGDKPLSEWKVYRLPTHICVTRPQWVNIGYMLDVWKNPRTNFDIFFRNVRCDCSHSIVQIEFRIIYFFIFTFTRFTILLNNGMWNYWMNHFFYGIPGVKYYTKCVIAYRMWDISWGLQFVAFCSLIPWGFCVTSGLVSIKWSCYIRMSQTEIYSRT